MALNSRTNLWTTRGRESVCVGSCVVMRIVFFPTAANQVIILTDKYGGRAIKLKAGASDASPVHISFADEGGRKLPNLRVGQIDGGEADIYLKKDTY